jgi:hypothetical protein
MVTELGGKPPGLVAGVGVTEEAAVELPDCVPEVELRLMAW